MPCYENGKLMIMAACYKSGNDKSDKNKDKVYLLLKRWGLVGHVLDHVLDHMRDHIIIYLVTKAL